MTSVTSSGVSSGASQQAGNLALLTKLFQTTGKPAESGKIRHKDEAASPPAPSQPPAQANSAAGLASMFEALQNDDTSSVSDLLSRLLQAVDTDGDGTISSDELQAVTELATGTPQHASRPSLLTADTGNDMTRTGPGDPAQDSAPGNPTSSYEALFQALQQVFAQAGGAAGATTAQRYTDLLQSMAKAE